MTLPKWSVNNMSSIDISNSAIGAGIAEVVNSKGVQATPLAMNTTEVIPSYDIQAGGFANPLPGTVAYAQNIAINGVATFERPMVGPDGFTISGNPPLIRLTGTDLQGSNCFRPQAGSLYLVFNAAGAIAFNGKVVRVYAYIRRSTTVAPAFIYFFRQTITTGILTYFHALPLPLPFILDSQVLVFGCESEDTTVFPAATTFTVCCIGISRVKGAMLPI